MKAIDTRARSIIKKHLRVRKYQGDDEYSWAVFKNGVAIYTGCARREAKNLQWLSAVNMAKLEATRI